ncbi:MAG: hypothetical protein QOD37_1242 [Gaiellales bacterium]|nr:hypothetical protein [Gaiellales bacterium]
MVVGTTELAAEERVLAHVARELRLEVLGENLDGGSAARVYKARREDDGVAVAVKVCVEQPGVVDGHDLASFTAKLTQIEAIRARAPALAARYAPVVDVRAGDGWESHTTLWYESTDAAACLRDGEGDVTRFERQCDAIFGDVFARGYDATAPVAAPPGYLARTNIGRFLRRFPMLERELPAALVGPERLVVNGVACRAPHVVLHELAGGAGPQLRHLGPTQLGLCAHGDANTRNLLVARARGEDVDFQIIDPRGSTDSWDPVYDLAKIVFSLSVWEPALRLGFALAHDEDEGWRVGFGRPTYPGYRAAIDAFLPYAERADALAALRDRDPHWRTRLLLTHDMHVLAEAACRLSDPKPKWDCHGRPSTPAALAMGHYLLGTLLVNDLVEQLARDGEVDAERHFGMLTGDFPTG